MVQHSPHLKREFTVWSSFSYAFAFISPIVALYGIFGLAIAESGPSFWLGFPIVFAGQLLVALVFAMLVSKWPYEGSIYQWSRRLLGPGFGWAAGWAYAWTMILAMAVVALGAAGFIANIFGVQDPSSAQRVWIAFGVMVFGVFANTGGRVILRIFTTASIAAEVIGSIGLGTVLLIFHRHNPVSVLTSGSTYTENPHYFALSGPFVVAIAFIGYSFLGFESAGSIAEEVHRPRRNLPKAIILSITFIAVVVMYSSLALILSIPDLKAVASGAVADPVYDTLTSQLGQGVAKPVEGLFVIGFVASFLAIQTTASRMIWSNARDRALPGSKFLGKLTRGQRQPVNALIVATVLGCITLLLSKVASNIYTLMVNFSVGSFYLAFLFPLVGALVVQLRGRWKHGEFRLGRFTLVITIVATTWTTFEFLNVSWPRAVYPQAYLNWSAWIGIAVIAVAGAIVYFSVRRRIAPVADDEPDESEETDHLLAAPHPVVGDPAH